MYIALVSFTTADYQIQKGQILAEDFETPDIIQDFLNANYIRVYSVGEEGIQSDTVYNIWTGTQQEYSAITTPNENTLYFIEED